MTKTLLDTDMLSEVGKGVDPVVARNAAIYRRTFGRYATSTVSIMEVISGFQRTNSFRRVQQFLASMATEEVLPFDQAAAEIAGRISGDLLRTGRPIGVADPMIAAVAIANGLHLATGNTRHYERIRQLGYPLMLVDWRA